MAPEVRKLKIGLNGERNESAMIDGCKADIYSFGITMLSLISPNVKSPVKLKENLA